MLQAFMHACSHTCAHTYACIHASTHTHAHTHIHSYTCMPAHVPVLFLCELFCLCLCIHVCNPQLKYCQRCCRSPRNTSAAGQGAEAHLARSGQSPDHDHQSAETDETENAKTGKRREGDPLPRRTGRRRKAGGVEIAQPARRETGGTGTETEIEGDDDGIVISQMKEFSLTEGCVVIKKKRNWGGGRFSWLLFKNKMLLLQQVPFTCTFRCCFLRRTFPIQA